MERIEVIHMGGGIEFDNAGIRVRVRSGPGYQLGLATDGWELD